MACPGKGWNVTRCDVAEIGIPLLETLVILGGLIPLVACCVLCRRQLQYVPPCPSPVPFLRPSLQPLPGTFHCALASLPAVPVVQPYFSHAFLSVPRLCFPCSYPYSPFPHRRPFHPRGVSRATPPRGNALRAAAVAGVRKHVRIRHAHSSPADSFRAPLGLIAPTIATVSSKKFCTSPDVLRGQSRPRRAI